MIQRVGKTDFLTLLFPVLMGIISGLLLNFSWPPNSTGIFVLISLIPLFFALQTTLHFSSYKRFFSWFIACIGLSLTWIGLSSMWLRTSSSDTHLLGTLFVSLEFSVCLLPTVFVAKRQGITIGSFFLLTSWMVFELIQSHFALGTPFYSMGYSLGAYPSLIQFYEFTGIEGGGLLILLINYFLFRLLSKLIQKEKIRKTSFYLVLMLLPLMISPLLYKDLSINKKVKVTALHTYQQTYNAASHQNPDKVLKGLARLSMLTQNSLGSRLLVWPETIISNIGWLHNLPGDKFYNTLVGLMKDASYDQICMGGIGFSLSKENQNDPYSVLDKQRNFYYRTHNVAITFDRAGLWQLRSKELFVPFQERIPFLKTLPFFKDWVTNVGINATLSYYENSEPIHRMPLRSNYSPLLCYESVFPLLTAKTSSETNILLVLANEFWNPKMKGSQQYFSTHIPTAIQSRIAIVRSSNNGISAMIDPNGKILSKRSGRSVGLLTANLPLKEDMTVYEHISGLFYYLSLLLYLVILTLSFLQKDKGSLHAITGGIK